MLISETVLCRELDLWRRPRYSRRFRTANHPPLCMLRRQCHFGNKAVGSRASVVGVGEAGTGLGRAPMGEGGRQLFPLRNPYFFSVAILLGTRLLWVNGGRDRKLSSRGNRRARCRSPSPTQNRSGGLFPCIEPQPNQHALISTSARSRRLSSQISISISFTGVRTERNYNWGLRMSSFSYITVSYLVIRATRCFLR